MKFFPTLIRGSQRYRGVFRKLIAKLRFEDGTGRLWVVFIMRIKISYLTLGYNKLILDRFSSNKFIFCVGGYLYLSHHLYLSLRTVSVIPPLHFILYRYTAAIIQLTISTRQYIALGEPPITVIGVLLISITPINIRVIPF